MTHVSISRLASPSQPMAKDDRRIPGASRITITEPCNYVSNVAYYTSMTTMCSHDQHANWTMPQRVVDLLVASFATLASGSSFLHASGTCVLRLFLLCCVFHTRRDRMAPSISDGFRGMARPCEESRHTD